MPNAECRMPNAECLTGDELLIAKSATVALRVAG
jgi:hypothetical protein